MSEPPPPYTGRSATAEPPTTQYAGYVTIWHSRALLIGVAALALLAAILTGIGAANFPSAAPVEDFYAFGVIVDMVAVAIAMAVMTVVEYLRRRDPIRLQLPVNRRPSVFAIVAVVMGLLTVVVWSVGGGPQQLIDMAQGLRARYMLSTGGLVFAGIPWVLSLVFGAWGFRPRANRLTNVFAIAGVAIGGVLAIVAIIAALVYGAGLSD